MLSQVIFYGTISKPQMLMSVTTKIAVQMNCKLGGEAWSIDVPVSVTSFYLLPKFQLSLLLLLFFIMNLLYLVKHS